MSTCVETLCTTGGFGTDAYSPMKRKPKLCMFKEEWIQHYAEQALRFWLQWQTPLGVARDYMEQIKEDLAKFYDEPLKKMFIEATY